MHKLLDIIKTSLGERFTTTDLLAEVSWPSVLYGGLTYNKKIPIVVNVLGSFTVGFADALARETFREKSAKNLNLAQASYEGFKQALITAGIEATLRLVKLPARYNRQQVEDAFRGAKGLGRQSWNGFTNILKANSEEIAEATTRISNYRTSNNLKGGNYGYLEGSVNGNTVDNKFWRSTSYDVAEREIHIFDAISVQGGGGSEWLRITDSEYRMLNKLASDLGAVKGGKYSNMTGELKIISENPYCASCTGIIQQFNEMFPNIKLILIDGAKYK